MSYIVPKEIPSDCTKCRWAMCNYPTVYCRLMHKGSDMLMAIKSRPDWCPLIEIPTPHGRLIDGDKFYKIMCSHWVLSLGEAYKRLEDFLKKPVIESEGSEE